MSVYNISHKIPAKEMANFLDPNRKHREMKSAQGTDFFSSEVVVFHFCIYTSQEKVAKGNIRCKQTFDF